MVTNSPEMLIGVRGSLNTIAAAEIVMTSLKIPQMERVTTEVRFRSLLCGSTLVGHQWGNVGWLVCRWDEKKVGELTQTRSTPSKMQSHPERQESLQHRTILPWLLAHQTAQSTARTLLRVSQSAGSQRTSPALRRRCY